MAFKVPIRSFLNFFGLAIILIFFVAHWYLSLFTQTFFLHRYAAHRAFTMSKGWEKFFFFLTWLTQGSSYLSATAYGIMHRMHHAFTDTEDDPHSPLFDKHFFAMMWRTKNVYSDIFDGTTKVEPRFTKNIPRWTSFDKFAHSYYSRLFWVAFYIGFYVVFAPSAWWFLLLPIHITMGPVHGVVINWFAHKYGHVNHETDNTSKNLFKIDWLMFGEGYHNNHHVYPSRSNFASERGEFDPCYPIIKFLNYTGVIQMVKEKPVPVSVKVIHNKEMAEEEA